VRIVRTAIDTNILSALWSGELTAKSVKLSLDQAAERGGLVICPVVYAELRAIPGVTASFVDKFLDDTDILAEWDLDKAVWQLAAELCTVCASQTHAENGRIKAPDCRFCGWCSRHAACRCPIYSRSWSLPEGLRRALLAPLTVWLTSCSGPGPHRRGPRATCEHPATTPAPPGSAAPWQLAIRLRQRRSGNPRAVRVPAHLRDANPSQ